MNSVNGFRFTDGHEDVFEIADDLYTYVEAEPFMWIDCLACQDYRSNGDGTYTAVDAWYGMSVDSLTSWVQEAPAPLDIAAGIVAAQCMRAYALDMQEYDDDEEYDTATLLDIAACHLLGYGAPDVLREAPGETYTQFVGKWRKALQASGVEIDC